MEAKVGQVGSIAPEPTLPYRRVLSLDGEHEAWPSGQERLSFAARYVSGKPRAEGAAPSVRADQPWRVVVRQARTLDRGLARDPIVATAPVEGSAEPIPGQKSAALESPAPTVPLERVAGIREVTIRVEGLQHDGPRVRMRSHHHTSGAGVATEPPKRLSRGIELEDPGLDGDPGVLVVDRQDGIPIPGPARRVLLESQGDLEEEPTVSGETGHLKLVEIGISLGVACDGDLPGSGHARHTSVGPGVFGEPDLQRVVPSGEVSEPLLDEHVDSGARNGPGVGIDVGYCCEVGAPGGARRRPARSSPGHGTKQRDGPKRDQDTTTGEELHRHLWP